VTASDAGLATLGEALRRALGTQPRAARRSLADLEGWTMHDEDAG
jgi:hypothetical protein